MSLFPFGEYWWFYVGFLLLVFVLLALDLGVFHRKAHAVSIREAAAWTVVWVTLALLFNVALLPLHAWHFPLDPRLMAMPGFDPLLAARETALEFLAGYVVEYSLSVDNIFVFVVVLKYFGVPAALQHRVLFFGILGALVFRGIFIALGAALLQFEWVVWLFGVFLVFTGVEDDGRRGRRRARRARGHPALPQDVAGHPGRSTARASSCGTRGGCTRRRCSSPCCSWR